MNNTWAIDVETVGLPTQSLQSLRGKDAQQIATLIELDRSKPKGERKIISNILTDPAKIEKDAEQKIANAQKLIREDDSLDPLTAKPICVVAVRLASASVLYRGLVTGSEQTAVDSISWGESGLAEFYDWCHVELPHLVGFNIRDFDLPVLRNWQARLSPVPVTYLPPLYAAWRDLLIEFAGWSGARHTTAHRLRDYVASLLDEEARMGGIVAEYLDSNFNGADVAQAYMDGNMDKIVHHCKLDCLMTALLAVKMGMVRE